MNILETIKRNAPEIFVAAFTGWIVLLVIGDLAGWFFEDRSQQGATVQREESASKDSLVPRCRMIEGIQVCE